MMKNFNILFIILILFSCAEEPNKDCIVEILNAKIDSNISLSFKIINNFDVDIYCEDINSSYDVISDCGILDSDLLIVRLYFNNNYTIRRYSMICCDCNFIFDQPTSFIISKHSEVVLNRGIKNIYNKNSIKRVKLILRFYTKNIPEYLDLSSFYDFQSNSFYIYSNNYILK